MPHLPVADIIVPESRQRTSIEDSALAALVDSIRSIGILQPLVIRKGEEGPTLIAGERRLRAIENIILMGERILFGGTLLPEGCAPVVDVGTLDSVAAFEAELEENIRRVDLTWQERLAAEAQLIELRRLQAERREEPAPTMLDLGRELAPTLVEARQREAARQASLLTEAFKTNPELAKAGSQNEAWKLYQRQEQRKRDAAMAEALGTHSALSLHTVIHADCTVWLPVQPRELFDCILIDPPYGMGADSFGDAAGRNSGIEHQYDDSNAAAMSLMQQTIPELFRVGKAQHHLYLWCDIDGFHQLRSLCEAAGYWTHRTPLINIKREGGRVPWPEHGPRRCYELVLYAVKGKKPTTAIYRDVFESTLERDTEGHGAAKPVESYVDLLKRSCHPGDSVLDCFAGTGTIIAAAHQLKLRATAVERDPAYYGQCLRRLEELK